MKAQISLSVDVDVWQLAKLRFPGQISNYVNSYLKTLLEVDEIEHPAEREQEELNILNKEFEMIKRKKQILQEKQKVRESEKERARIKAKKDKKLSDKELLTELTRQQEEMKRINPARW